MYGRDKNLNNSPAMADFTAQSSNGVSFKFVNCSWYEPTIFNWTISNGDTSTDKDVTYTFPENGTFTVTLTAENAYGVGNSKTMEIVVKGAGERLIKDNGEQFVFNQDVITVSGNYGAGLGVDNI
jgi:PKD repeat protein